MLALGLRRTSQLLATTSDYHTSVNTAKSVYAKIVAVSAGLIDLPPQVGNHAHEQA